MKKIFLSSHYKLLYSLIGVLFSIPVVAFLFMFWRIPIFNIFFFLVIIFATIRSIYWIKHESITISNSGIEYDTPGMVLEINWENIQKISHCWRWFIRQECLIVDQSQVKIKEWAIYSNSYSHPFENYFQNIAIPLTSFSENWRDSELGQQIKQYAPHLFQ